MSKGSNFEREIPKELSLWWTKGDRSDIFWRSDGSGGRATQRSKKGLSTALSYGDIGLLDPIGLPLVNTCVIELKRGYRCWSFLDVIDKPPMRKNAKKEPTQVYEDFLTQVLSDAERAGGLHPILITKRDKRKKCITIPQQLAMTIKYHNNHYIPAPSIIINHMEHSMICLDFYSFLEWCEPKFFIKFEGMKYDRTKKEKTTIQDDHIEKSVKRKRRKSTPNNNDPR